MMPPVAMASLSLVAGWFGVGMAIRLLMRAAKAIARRTRTKRDDRAVEEVEAFLRKHPEAIGAVEELLRRLRS